MASRSLDDLHPSLKPLAEELLSKCKETGFPVLIFCTYRSPEEQNLIFSQGRTKPGPILTYQKGGQSKHNFQENGKPASKAFDCVPVCGGKLNWTGKGPDWDNMVDTAKAIGLKWGGDWLMKDNDHFEMNELAKPRTFSDITAKNTILK